jgi:hypothetical protein
MRRWKLYFGCLFFGASLALASDYVTDFGVNDPDAKASAKISTRKLSDGSRAYQASFSAKNAAAISPSDSTDLPNVASAIYLGVAGDITVNMAGTGTAILFKAVPVGTVLQGQFARVKATGTTATNLIELY